MRVSAHDWVVDCTCRHETVRVEREEDEQRPIHGINRVFTPRKVIGREFVERGEQVKDKMETRVRRLRASQRDQNNFE
jgi:hypothetical protein